MKLVLGFFFIVSTVRAAPGFVPLERHALAKLFPSASTGVFQLVARPRTEAGERTVQTGTAFLLEKGKDTFLVTTMSRLVPDEDRAQEEQTLRKALAEAESDKELPAIFRTTFQNGLRRSHVFDLFHPPQRNFRFAHDAKMPLELQAYLSAPLLELVDIPSTRRAASDDGDISLAGTSEFLAYRHATDLAVFRWAGKADGYRALRLAEKEAKVGDTQVMLGYPHDVHPPFVTREGKVDRMLQQVELHVSEGKRIDIAEIRTISGLPKEVRASRITAFNHAGVHFSDIDMDFKCIGAPILNAAGEVTDLLVGGRYTLPQNRARDVSPTLYVYPEYAVTISLRRAMELIERARALNVR